MGVINIGIDYFNTGVLTKAMEMLTELVVLTMHSMWNLRAKTKQNVLAKLICKVSGKPL